MDARSRYAITFAAFAVVLFLVLAITVSGFISLLADREVLTEKDAGPLIGPVMFAVATSALFLQLITLAGARTGTKPGARPATKPSARPGAITSPVLGAFAAAAVTYLLFLLSGATLYTLGKGQPLLGVLFFGSNALAPFALSVAVIAFVIALVYLLMLAYRDTAGGIRTPRWWWENRDERDRNERDRP